MAAGAVRIQGALLGPPSPGVVISASIFDGIPNLFFAVMKNVLNLLKGAFQARRIETDMKLAINPECLANGKDAIGSSAELTT